LEFKPTLNLGDWIQVSVDHPEGEEPRVPTGKDPRACLEIETL